MKSISTAIIAAVALSFGVASVGAHESLSSKHGADDQAGASN